MIVFLLVTVILLQVAVGTEIALYERIDCTELRDRKLTVEDTSLVCPRIVH
jgi:hypothetical protein